MVARLVWDQEVACSNHVAPTQFSAMKSILVIDDSEEFCGLARRALERVGYAVDTCQQVEPALELLATGLRPSLVVLDAIMPGRDGFDFISAAAKIAPELKVLLVSGWVDLDALPATVKVTGKLEKPFTPDQLLEAVRGAVGDPRSRT